MNFKETALLRAFGLWKVPLIFYIRPSVLSVDDTACRIRIPFLRRNRNHLNCMYFGVLACGADIAGGLMAMRLIELKKEPVNLIFKDLKADFLKRAEGDVIFECKDGPKIQALVKRAIETGERQSEPVEIIATCPSKLGDEPVAKFTLTLSLKKKPA